MPKIDVNRKHFYSLLGSRLSDTELESILPVAKSELDEAQPETLKIELNDTNRPDLWSSTGLARQLRIHLQKTQEKSTESTRNTKGAAASNSYAPRQRSWLASLANTPTNEQNAHTDLSTENLHEIHVDPTLENIRPIIAGFIARGRTVSADLLNEIIQVQEKICWNYGQKRKALAMGIYRSKNIEFPVQYKAVKPDTTRFVPLGLEEDLSLKEILAQHPKGREFGHIVSDFSSYPLLCDSKNGVLSFPPVINSADIGAVEEGDSDLFVEMTGTNLQIVLLALNILACNLSDEGFEIVPLRVVYPYDTDYGRRIVTPCYFQETQSVERARIDSLLGVKLSTEEIISAVEAMGSSAEFHKDRLVISPPAYRNDFLHGVDIIEDIMIGRGMNTFTPELPKDFTIGRLTQREEQMRRIRNTLVGLGFQEMMFNYLGSAIDYIYKMDPALSEIQAEIRESEKLSDKISPGNIIQIANPMSENYEFVRNSILPALLSAEAVSGNTPYPHYIFECGKTAELAETLNDGSGTVSINSLALLITDKEVGYNSIASQISTFMYYMNAEYTVNESQDKRFIPGRAADLIVRSQNVGVFGELHPGIISNWGISFPVCACEINIDKLLEKKQD